MALGLSAISELGQSTKDTIQELSGSRLTSLIEVSEYNTSTRKYSSKQINFCAVMNSIANLITASIDSAIRDLSSTVDIKRNALRSECIGNDNRISNYLSTTLNAEIVSKYNDLTARIDSLSTTANDKFFKVNDETRSINFNTDTKLTITAKKGIELNTDKLITLKSTSNPSGTDTADGVNIITNGRKINITTDNSTTGTLTNGNQITLRSGNNNNVKITNTYNRSNNVIEGLATAALWS